MISNPSLIKRSGEDRMSGGNADERSEKQKRKGTVRHRTKGWKIIMGGQLGREWWWVEGGGGMRGILSCPVVQVVRTR